MTRDEPVVGEPLRHHFSEELEQLRLQVEVMAARVNEAVLAAKHVLADGNRDLALATVQADDEIDAMLVSLTEHCYDLLRREGPVASDLRLVVSVIRILEELERIGDLALRIVKTVDEHATLAAHPAILTTLVRMAGLTAESFGIALDAWSTRKAELVSGLEARERLIDDQYAELTTRLLSLSGDDATHVAILSVVIGRALERISDHAVVIAERLGYLLTGDLRYLKSEVR